jgi:hypothetical protein
MNAPLRSAPGPRVEPDSRARVASRDVLFPLWLRIAFWICIAIAVAVVVRRAIALLTPASSGAPPQLAQLDAIFRSEAATTWVHISCALAFVLLLPFVFWRRTRDSRVVERTFFALGFVVAGTAYAMSRYAVGGWLERTAVLVFDTLFLASLARALWFARLGEVVSKRLWMLRAVAVLLGIATTRPVMGVFFATARATKMTPQQFFGIAFWIGFSINVVAMELWLRAHRSRAERILR